LLVERNAPRSATFDCAGLNSPVTESLFSHPPRRSVWLPRDEDDQYHAEFAVELADEGEQKHDIGLKDEQNRS
jgi:hypothetical protein